MTPPKPRVLLLWHSLSGYWAAAFRALAERAEVTVLVRPPDPLAPYDYDAFDLGGATLEVAPYPWSFSLLDELIERTRPDITCSIGQSVPLWRALRRARRRHHTTTVMFTDNMWLGRPRQRVLQVLFVPLRHLVFDKVYVPGARATEYVHRLGFPDGAVLPGSLTLDAAPFTAVAEGSVDRWTDPRFLFCGRLVPDKAPDVMAEAYRLYRESSADPWPLQVVGHGPFDGGLRGLPGVTLSDFVQPEALPDIYAAAGALVLPSRYDSWGVVALEACAAGLPVVISDGCGAADEMATPANGFTVAGGDPSSLARALTMVAAASTDQRRQWGRRSSDIASSYRPERWADTVLSARSRNDLPVEGVLTTTDVLATSQASGEAHAG
jgi:glycosyltransferase involved in cell wall biosynthesis